jgi:hypothetical protein
MNKPFRELAADEVRQAFGDPEVIPVKGGQLYRWVLKRQHGSHVFVTIDSPEIPTICHIMISDPSSKAVEPVTNMTLRTLDEVRMVIERIRDQWQTPESSGQAQDIGVRDYIKNRAAPSPQSPVARPPTDAPLPSPSRHR